MSTLVNEATPRRFNLWRRRRAAHESRADWAAVGELARRMQRQELFDAIAANRRRRELAREETEAASNELDTLLAFGRDNRLAPAAQLAELAGMTRAGAHHRIGSAPPDPLELDVAVA